MSALQEQLDTLQAAGAAQHDPVHWHYLQTLARRADQQEPAVRQRLETRLHGLLAALQQRMHSAAPLPPAGRRGAGDALAPLRELRRMLEQPSASPDLAAPTDPPPPAVRTELRAVRQARETWSRLSADKQLAAALAQAPQNAGPINSQQVVLRTLQRMRALSPAYFQQFMSYADTLLCLEQAQAERSSASKVSSKAREEKRPKPAAAAPGAARQRRSPQP